GSRRMEHVEAAVRRIEALVGDVDVRISESVEAGERSQRDHNEKTSDQCSARTQLLLKRLAPSGDHSRRMPGEARYGNGQLTERADTRWRAVVPTSTRTPQSPLDDR